MSVDKASIIRLIALLASVAAFFGLNVPDSIQEYVAGAVMLGVTLYGFWKNNPLSKKGKKQKELLEKNGLYKEW